MSSTPKSSDVVLSNGVALVGPDLVERAFRKLTLANDTIGEFDTEEDAEEDAQESLDLGVAYVIPGLVDCHVHFDLAAHPVPYLQWRKTGDPRKDIAVLRAPRLVIAQGKVVRRDWLEETLGEYAGVLAE